MRADNYVKIPGDSEVLQHPVNHRLRLGGRNREAASLLMELLQKLPHAGVDVIFIDALRVVALTEIVNCPPGFLLVHAVPLPEGKIERRSDKRLELLKIRLLDSHLMQRILHGSCNSRSRLRKRTIQIKQNILKCHFPSPVLFSCVRKASENAAMFKRPEGRNVQTPGESQCPNARRVGNGGRILFNNSV